MYGWGHKFGAHTDDNITKVMVNGSECRTDNNNILTRLCFSDGITITSVTVIIFC